MTLLSPDSFPALSYARTLYCTASCFRVPGGLSLYVVPRGVAIAIHAPPLSCWYTRYAEKFVSRGVLAPHDMLIVRVLLEMLHDDFASVPGAAGTTVSSVIVVEYTDDTLFAPSRK